MINEYTYFDDLKEGASMTFTLPQRNGRMYTVEMKWEAAKP